MFTTETTAESSASAQQPLGDLVGKLSTDLQNLVRQETEFAAHELDKKLDYAKLQAATLSAGLALATAGGLVLLGAAVLVVALWLPAWAAALLVGGGASVVGVLLTLRGQNRLARLQLQPKHTLTSLKRDVTAIKEAAT